MQAPDGHATAERRSLAYHRAVAQRLDEDMRAQARERVERWAAEGLLAEPYAQRWRRLLDLPLDDLARAITADDEATRDLRQTTPFPGVLSNGERWAIVREVR